MKTIAADTDLGLRALQRRTSLGLTLEQVAQRAGMSVDYLEYVESRRGHPSLGVVRRLADALHTTVEHLYGQSVLEPGMTFAQHLDTIDLRERRVSRLSEAECLLMLGSVLVGRVAFVVTGAPLVLPLNFTVMGREIVLQTAETSELATAASFRRLASFEVDDIDEPSRLGWSVLCQGQLRRLTPAETAEHDADALGRPWYGDDRRTVVVLRPTSITGRRIGPA